VNVRYTLRARADLEEIGDYITQHNPSAAGRVCAAIRRSIGLVKAFPKRGRKQKEFKVRKVGAGKYPYSIYYCVDEIDRAIVVLQIRHAARRTKYRDR
jgi:toxin ParE1/3/4